MQRVLLGAQTRHIRPSETEEREEEDRGSKGKAGEHRYGRASQNTD